MSVTWVMQSTSGGQNMARKSKKKKAEGLEKHRQMKKAKKMQKKEKKKAELPKKYRQARK